MPQTQQLIRRFREECRTVGSKARETAQRAFRQGVLRVDLVSLRRDRGRVLADLGERVLRIWNRGLLPTLETDAEVARLRTLIRTIEEQIAAKEAEAAALREAGPAPAASAGPSDAGTPNE